MTAWIDGQDLSGLFWENQVGADYCLEHCKKMTQVVPTKRSLDCNSVFAFLAMSGGLNTMI